MDREAILNMDTNILVSLVNMKLRDFYNNLESYCDDVNVTTDELQDKLSKAGYYYDRNNNQFK